MTQARRATRRGCSAPARVVDRPRDRWKRPRLERSDERLRRGRLGPLLERTAEGETCEEDDGGERERTDDEARAPSPRAPSLAPRALAPSARAELGHGR